jgi:hypothetical protein
MHTIPGFLAYAVNEPAAIWEAGTAVAWLARLTGGRVQRQRSTSATTSSATTRNGCRRSRVVEQLDVLPGCVDAATSVPRSEQVLVAELPSGGAATLR